MLERDFLKSFSEIAKLNNLSICLFSFAKFLRFMRIFASFPFHNYTFTSWKHFSFDLTPLKCLHFTLQSLRINLLNSCALHIASSLLSQADVFKSSSSTPP
ncbi:hypothetical protein CW304_32310 [Bacillus sp. UFRGS-B20]|nr:hypothetical protein CW304_32310 [Bacillus sp. UFRGS-B20]